MAGLQKHLIPDNLHFWNAKKYTVNKSSRFPTGTSFARVLFTQANFYSAKIRPKFQKNYAVIEALFPSEATDVE